MSKIEELNDDLVKCELCKQYVNCMNSNIFILQKDKGLLIDELVLCAECFDDNKETLKKEDWTSDDFSDNDE